VPKEDELESILIAVGSALGGAIGAALGWGTTSFVGAPIRKFFDLRGEVIRRLVEFANVPARWKEVRDDSGFPSGQVEDMDLTDKEIERLEEAQHVLRDLASQMLAFAENEIFAAWFIRRVMRFDPKAASRGLIGLSNEYDTYGGSRAFQRKTIETALRISGT
jgi:hypothetical protein